MSPLQGWCPLQEILDPATEIHCSKGAPFCCFCCFLKNTSNNTKISALQHFHCPLFLLSIGCLNLHLKQWQIQDFPWEHSPHSCFTNSQCSYISKNLNERVRTLWEHCWDPLGSANVKGRSEVNDGSRISHKEGSNLVGGHGLLRQLCLENFVCQN